MRGAARRSQAASVLIEFGARRRPLFLYGRRRRRPSFENTTRRRITGGPNSLQTVRPIDVVLRVITRLQIGPPAPACRTISRRAAEEAPSNWARRASQVGVVFCLEDRPLGLGAYIYFSSRCSSDNDGGSADRKRTGRGREGRRLKKQRRGKVGHVAVACQSVAVR